MDDATPPLDDFLREYEQDNNVWWELSCGHHMNLFEAAVERMQEAEKLLSRLILPSEAFVVPQEDPHDLEMRANPYDMDDDERSGH